jgi:CBS domain-containing protein
MYEFIHYQVRDVMTENPVTVDRHERIGSVEEIFEAHDFNGLPVVESDGRLVGMVTKLDVLKAFVFTSETLLPRYQDIMSRSIESVMTVSPHLVEPKLPLTGVITLMLETRHKSFPVVSDGRLVGVIAREDLLRALRHSAQGKPPDRLLAEQA